MVIVALFFYGRLYNHHVSITRRISARIESPVTRFGIAATVLPISIRKEDGATDIITRVKE